MKLTMNNETVQFLKNMSSMIQGDNSNYYYIPYWFASTENPNEFEVIKFEYLPKELIEKVKNLRGEDNEI